MAFGAKADWQIYDEAGRRKYLNDRERVRFLEEADRLDVSTRLLCRTLAYTGCRISEALSLRAHQLDVHLATLTIRTLKRRRSAFRVIPIPVQLAAELAALLEHGGASLWTMHRASAWRSVKLVMQRAEIEGPMASCKGLRHGFGICAASRNIPLSLIQRWMGHASLAMTSVYLDAVGIEERKFAARMWQFPSA